MFRDMALMTRLWATERLLEAVYLDASLYISRLFMMRAHQQSLEDEKQFLSQS
jgi:hypothetical protein